MQKLNFVVVFKLKYSLVLQQVYQEGFTCSWTGNQKSSQEIHAG